MVSKTDVKSTLMQHKHARTLKRGKEGIEFLILDFWLIVTAREGNRGTGRQDKSLREREHRRVWEILHQCADSERTVVALYHASDDFL